MEILSHPNPALKLVAVDVEPRADASLKRLVRTMAQAMYSAQGIGLAATQLGVLKRVIVYDVADELVALCNPRIISSSEETVTDEEGCLSLPGITVPIERSAAISCEALDLDGNPVTIKGEDLLARLIQHEIDHLDGVLIIDRATAEERKLALKRYHDSIQTVP